MRFSKLFISTEDFLPKVVVDKNLINLYPDA